MARGIDQVRELERRVIEVEDTSEIMKAVVEKQEERISGLEGDSDTDKAIEDLGNAVRRLEQNIGGWPALLKDEEASARAQEEELANRLMVVEAWAERTTRQLEELEKGIAGLEDRSVDLEVRIEAAEAGEWWRGSFRGLEKRLEVLEGPPSFEIRWMKEEKAILLAAILYIGVLAGPGDSSPSKLRLQSAVRAYEALVAEHDPPEEEVDDDK